MNVSNLSIQFQLLKTRLVTFINNTANIFGGVKTDTVMIMQSINFNRIEQFYTFKTQKITLFFIKDAQIQLFDTAAVEKFNPKWLFFCTTSMYSKFVRPVMT